MFVPSSCCFSFCSLDANDVSRNSASVVYSLLRFAFLSFLKGKTPSFANFLSLTCVMWIKKRNFAASKIMACKSV